MPETIITVQGAARGEYAPERAVLSFTIAGDGSEREPVVADVAAALERVTAALREHHDARSGPVAAWSTDRLAVTAQRPWSSTGEQLPLVHRASVGGTATVSGLDALPALVDALAAEPLAAIDGIEWMLGEGRRTAVLTEVRSRAVKDAVTKATVYAQSIGLGSVTALALADPGMLGDQGQGEGASPRMSRIAMMGGDSRSPGISLRPEPIVIEAAVDARFAAR